jgi:hypothetical protein
LIAGVDDAGVRTHVTGLLVAMAQDPVFRAACFEDIKARSIYDDDHAQTLLLKLVQRAAFRQAKTSDDFVMIAKQQAALMLIDAFTSQAFPCSNDQLLIASYLKNVLAKAFDFPAPAFEHTELAQSVLRSEPDVIAKALMHVQANHEQQAGTLLLSLPAWEAYVQNGTQADQMKASTLSILDLYGAMLAEGMDRRTHEFVLRTFTLQALTSQRLKLEEVTAAALAAPVRSRREADPPPVGPRAQTTNTTRHTPVVAASGVVDGADGTARRVRFRPDAVTFRPYQRPPDILLTRSARRDVSPTYVLEQGMAALAMPMDTEMPVNSDEFGKLLALIDHPAFAHAKPTISRCLRAQTRGLTVLQEAADKGEVRNADGLGNLAPAILDVLPSYATHLAESNGDAEAIHPMILVTNAMDVVRLALNLDLLPPSFVLKTLTAPGPNRGPSVLTCLAQGLDYPPSSAALTGIQARLAASTGALIHALAGTLSAAQAGDATALRTALYAQELNQPDQTFMLRLTDSKSIGSLLLVDRLTRSVLRFPPGAALPDYRPAVERQIKQLRARFFDRDLSLSTEDLPVTPNAIVRDWHHMLTDTGAHAFSSNTSPHLLER